MRIDKDDYYLKIADTVSLRGTCLRRNYGAVIVKDDEIISTGYTGSPRGSINCCDTRICERKKQNIPHGSNYELCESVHAEMNAIISAARKDMKGSTLYLSGRNADGTFIYNPTPCRMCSRMIKNAGIQRVIVKSEEGNTIKQTR